MHHGWLIFGVIVALFLFLEAVFWVLELVIEDEDCDCMPKGLERRKWKDDL